MCQITTDHSEAQLYPQTLLDIALSNPLCKKAFEFAQQRYPPSIFNHCLRVYYYAKNLADQESSNGKTYGSTASINEQACLFIACILHELGACDEFDGAQRFEVEGADAAVTFLIEHAPGISEESRQDVWTAIACHTSPDIGERIGALARLVRLAVLSDFNRPGLRAKFHLEVMTTSLEKLLPRLEVEKVLGDMLVAQMMKRSGVERLRKAPNNSWPGSLLRGKLEAGEGFEGVNKYF